MRGARYGVLTGALRPIEQTMLCGVLNYGIYVQLDPDDFY
jgi:hypothetical protein